jgi:predicted CXXCH cytochrome family protein
LTAAATRVLLAFAALLLIVPAGQGCAPATRYHILSFFFDGVPLPEGMQAPAKTGASPNAKPAAQKIVVARHAPYAKKQCSACHTPMTNTLLASVPELCFRCHKMGQSEKRYVHAPSLAGFCRLCHDPHASTHPFLLLASPREMCFYCHNPEDIAKNQAHGDNEAPCTQCHNPHADNRYYLRAEIAALRPPEAPAPSTGAGATTDAAREARPLPEQTAATAPQVARVAEASAALAVAVPAGPVAARDEGAPWEPRRAPDASVPRSLSRLFELWQLQDAADAARHWTVFNFQAKLLPVYFDGAEPFSLPGLAFVTAPATEAALRAWNLPCLVREVDEELGPRFVVLAGIEGNRAIVFGPEGERVDYPLSLWLKQVSGEAAFLVPVEAIPEALHPGDEGPAVLALQQELARAGFLAAVPNAVYDDATADAVRALQISLGLEQDGTASRALRLRLLQLDGRTLPLLQKQP